MSWKEVDRMSLKKEFVRLALQEGANVSELCRRFAISRKTGHKWIARYREHGEEGLRERSRRPRTCPHRTPAEVEAAVVAVRRAHPLWGGRKIVKVLQNRGWDAPPAPSTVTAVLSREGLLEEAERARHRPAQRFERAAPNELLQMDFKGDFPTLAGRCHPLTLLDDHSRFALGLFACAEQGRETVQACLEQVFRRYGLPHALLADNGAPWGGGEDCEFTRLGVWLMRLGVRVLHGRPSHPQTQGKIERFHRTLKAELLRGANFCDWEQCQRHFDLWRDEYNYRRPHEALGLDTPGHHYRPSPVPFPETLPPVEYDPGCKVRKVQSAGRLNYGGVEYRVGRAFVGLPVGLRESESDGVLEVLFCRQRIAWLDLKTQTVRRTGRREGSEAE